MDLSQYDALELEVKTDGRVYIAQIKTESAMEDDLYQHVFSTRPNQWEQVVLPFSEFVLTWQGWVEGENVPLEPQRVIRFGVVIGERKNGPFRCQIRAINVLHRARAFGRATLVD